VTFRPRLRHSLDRNLSYTRLIEHAGLQPGRQVLSLSETEADEREAKALGIPVDAPLTKVERVRSADRRPVIHSIDAIPSRYLSGVTEGDLKGSLYELFERLGHSVAHGEATIEPVLSDEYRCRALQVDRGSPLLHIAQIDYSTAGEAVMFSLEWHVPGIFELSLLRRAT
jgi:GntR family transcriptional regulator